MGNDKKTYELYKELKKRVEEWRENNYTSDYPAIREIFEFNIENQTLRYLRKAQFEALETYWYLRLMENTPHVFDLYRKYFQGKDLLNALGIRLTEDDLTEILLSNGGGIEVIFKKIKEDDDFVRKYRLEALRESLFLSYPSYIFALAMGAGKTVLIGSIIATEFAMALEYPDGPFVKNALVFAPGKTILGALKEISDIPYEKILPPRLYKQFITHVKITYTRDNEKDIPIVQGSSFNVIITNTEKIRIQKQSITKSLLRNSLFSKEKEEEMKELIANQRLQTIASLPNLAIFSDEAHHTYGQELGKELKRVRQTVNYLAENTNVLVVVNTTGTPYYKKQILKDVVYWYGLSQGIKDGILKEVRDNIVAYPNISSEEFLKDVVDDFLKNYKDVKIYDGSLAKLAIYFPRIEDLKEARPVIEEVLFKHNLDPSITILEVHNSSPKDVQDLFDNRINDPNVPYRIFLLVNKGTEGWNCPSLFAVALARKLRTSNNFVLQAATRCLRQPPGNKVKAKIYLSKDNVSILDSQLQETYGESLKELNRTAQSLIKEKIVVRKTEIPPVILKRKVRRVVPINSEKKLDVKLQKPNINAEEIKKNILKIDESAERKILVIYKQEKVSIEPDYIDIYSLAVELADTYRLPVMDIYTKLKELYPEGELSEIEALDIKRQIEEQVRSYEIIEETVEYALALIKKQGFKEEKEGDKSIYVAEIVVHKDRAEKLLLKYKDQSNFGFHYSPYNFDSLPEKYFFEDLLKMLNEDPDEIEDIYFTGAITDPDKTDFIFEYKDRDGKWRRYSPDFLIRKKNGKMLIVEIKGEPYKDEQKEKAIREIENLNQDKLKYEILIVKRDEVPFEEIEKVKNWIYENSKEEKHETAKRAEN